MTHILDLIDQLRAGDDSGDDRDDRHGSLRTGGGVQRLVDVVPAAVAGLKYQIFCGDRGWLAL